jgi:phosphopantothenoylcysteine decarboxylase/phosphopantothenate--cysteine ligase
MTRGRREREPAPPPESLRGPPVLLITAGPSREHFDDIRFISNGATGALGIALARAAVDAGWRTILALGPTHLEPPDGAELHRFVSAEELDAICAALWPEVEAFIATAAVCDHRPGERLPGKRKKDGGDWPVRLVPTPDVLANRAEEKGSRVLVGFSLESGAGPEEARRKLVKKRLDLILWNAPANLGAPDGRYTWIEAGDRGAVGTERDLGLLAKEAVADRILRFVSEAWARRRESERLDEER